MRKKDVDAHDPAPITMYDPPSGWLYGFPKPYKPQPNETIEDTLIRDGYPITKIKNGFAKYCRFWEV